MDIMKCQNCEYIGTYQGIPVHWCEFFKPGIIHKNYPNPLKGCPNYAETQKLTEKHDKFW